jgi:AraC family transcriptional activator of pobA
MEKTDIRLHISSKTVSQRLALSDTDVRVPRYSLYGDASASRDWFVNVEPLDQRASTLDWRIEPHTHPKFTQLVFVAGGAGEMTLDGDTLHFASPSVLVVPPFRIHGFRYGQPAAGHVVTIENNYLGELLVRAPDLRSVLESAGAFSLSSDAHYEITRHLDALNGELLEKRKGGSIAAEIQLLQIVLVMLRDRPTAQAGAPSARAGLVDRFLELVESCYRAQPDIEALAGQLGVTTGQLRNACKDTIGLSPLAVLHGRIAAEAKRCLMYTPMSIAEIGYGLGFDDAAYFSRFFTRLLGVTPTKFRQG